MKTTTAARAIAAPRTRAAPPSRPLIAWCSNKPAGTIRKRPSCSRTSAARPPAAPMAAHAQTDAGGRAAARRVSHRSRATANTPAAWEKAGASVM